jgi:hypothetical protein
MSTSVGIIAKNVGRSQATLSSDRDQRGVQTVPLHLVLPVVAVVVPAAASLVGAMVSPSLAVAVAPAAAAPAAAAAVAGGAGGLQRQVLGAEAPVPAAVVGLTVAQHQLLRGLLAAIRAARRRWWRALDVRVPAHAPFFGWQALISTCDWGGCIQGLHDINTGNPQPVQTGWFGPDTVCGGRWRL